jgi:hypothetical protein
MVFFSTSFLPYFSTYFRSIASLSSLRAAAKGSTGTLRRRGFLTEGGAGSESTSAASAGTGVTGWDDLFLFLGKVEEEDLRVLVAAAASAASAALEEVGFSWSSEYILLSMEMVSAVVALPLLLLLL